MTNSRAAGILLHITSLPSRFGVGDLGSSAYEFVDLLSIAGQSIWQVLPLCPSAKENSPYSSYSAFAGNMLLISPESLAKSCWISDSSYENWTREYESSAGENLGEVDFEKVTQFKRRLLRIAFDESLETLDRSTEFTQFCDDHAWWLDDFAKFEALKEITNEGDWTAWPPEYRVPGKFDESKIPQLSGEIRFAKFKQFLFETQWLALKSYANGKGISFCGDLPIFVALASADVWANQEQFQLDTDGNPEFVAGVPPDYFSETGQLWGNPLYDWSTMEADNFGWWTDRFRRTLEQFDLFRVDHFRGFDRYWSIPADAESAVEGSWTVGPRGKPFRAAETVLGELPIWAEDLGDIDQGVHDLRDELGFPPMRVLQFGYSDRDDNFHRHDSMPTHCVAYTGTHDNDTLMGWFDERDQPDSGNDSDVLAEFLTGDQSIHFQIIGLLYHSSANHAIVPLQDVLGLGNEARMNVPGKANGNWGWRAEPRAFTPEIAQQLQAMVEASGRIKQTN